MRVFDCIARGYAGIQVTDLVGFLERNSFYPRSDDIEAILRRCDHDANRQISYAEFCESTSLDGVPSFQSNGPREELSASVKEDKEINDRVEESVEEQKESANKSSAKRRTRQTADDNLTPAQRQIKRDEEERIASQTRAEIEQQIEADRQKVRDE